MWTILIASQDESLHQLVTQTLQDIESRMISVSSIKAFFEKLAEEKIDLIIYDADLLPLSAMEAFSVTRVSHPRIPSILIYENENFEATKSLIDKGVLFRMAKPIAADNLKQIYASIRKTKMNGAEVY
ncbi:MAG: hypothetical protein ALAOOOJD_00462 [bacterium]|nr:hypothetical protein [bacterium]